MDQYEPSFLANADEIEFLRYTQQILDSLKLVRRRAGFKVAAVPDAEPLSDRDTDGEDEIAESNTITMACYKVEVQSDNEIAMNAISSKQEVSRYAFDDILKQEYLEELDFVSIDEDVRDDDAKATNVGTNKQTLPNTAVGSVASTDTATTISTSTPKNSILPSCMLHFCNGSQAACKPIKKKHNQSKKKQYAPPTLSTFTVEPAVLVASHGKSDAATIYQHLYEQQVFQSPRESPSSTETSDIVQEESFQGALSILSSVFSGL